MVVWYYQFRITFMMLHAENYKDTFELVENK